uniref:FAST kinase leucine-rich domain-containing protein n=1 Tax=Chromera velia CCMP2878 TaxID=1169474 RepID=A0A0G4IFF8_9ALVE|eukprot:Cvel_2486.t1-p1 / transcript=Cvel_2486.t1 / gene=Cvel_2486 / organism=Chromera_velia_CCMP2878 / gene_product=hypothetical protein / transcript_product=hypothetical protein / location=Cvel_scaffold97:129514-132415(-) / protein_length=752 / sequence_SO=supercontig / SO=protein_coding / is_pseudo=false
MPVLLHSASALQRHGLLACISALRTQQRRYTPPSKRDWSYQNRKVFTPRPLVENFAYGRLHPQKEWWRERKLTPDTFMGFPDIAKISLRGGSLYQEQMDPVTLSVILDRMVQMGIDDEDVWRKLCHRAQQIAHKTTEPDLCYIYRAIAQGDWFDLYFFTTFLGRIQRRLPYFTVLDCAVVIEAMGEPKFRHGSTLQAVLRHLELMVDRRDDHKAVDLAVAAEALRLLPRSAHSPSPFPLHSDPAPMPLTERRILSKIGKALLTSELGDVPLSLCIAVLDSLAAHRLPAGELGWALVQEIRRHRRDEMEETDVNDLVALLRALCDLHIVDGPLASAVLEIAVPERHRLRPDAAALLLYALGKMGGPLKGLPRPSPPVLLSLVKTVTSGDRWGEGFIAAEEGGGIEAASLAHAAYGALRLGGGRPMAGFEETVQPLLVRLAGRLGSASLPSLVLVLDALGRCSLESEMLDALAGALFAEVLERLKAGEGTPRDLCAIAFSFSFLAPESPELIQTLFTRALSEVSVSSVSARSFSKLITGTAACVVGGEAERVEIGEKGMMGVLDRFVEEAAPLFSPDSTDKKGAGGKRESQLSSAVNALNETEGARGGGDGESTFLEVMEEGDEDEGGALSGPGTRSVYSVLAVVTALSGVPHAGVTHREFLRDCCALITPKVQKLSPTSLVALAEALQSLGIARSERVLMRRLSEWIEVVKYEIPPAALRKAADIFDAERGPRLFSLETAQSKRGGPGERGTP